jgi:hypothetical protein
MSMIEARPYSREKRLCTVSTREGAERLSARFFFSSAYAELYEMGWNARYQPFAMRFVSSPVIKMNAGVYIDRQFAW